MRFVKNVLLCFILSLGLSEHAQARTFPLFDIQQRERELQTPAYQSIRNFCMADNLKPPSDKIPAPVKELVATEGYGTDHALNDFSWFMMVHSGRALAGDAKSAALVKQALLLWSEEKALYATKENYDPYFALKRGLIPTITAYAIIENNLNDKEKKQIETWIDNLVRRLPTMFGGDVDRGNHRYLADSVLALWGSFIGDKTLYKMGKERFEIALSQTRYNGTLPIETRRGARAQWYMRLSLSALTLIAKVAQSEGDNLFDMEQKGKSLDLTLNALIDMLYNPLFVFAYASENLIPGPSDNFLVQDGGMFETRGKSRHYMAFGELYVHEKKSWAAQRLNKLMRDNVFSKRPLIDEFVGGNATCFWGEP